MIHVPKKHSYQLDNDASIYYDRELYIDCNLNKSKVRELLFTDKVHFEANEDVEEHVGIVLRYKLFRWNLHSFLTMMSNGQLSSKCFKLNESCLLLVNVANFNEMTWLFGNGRTRWTIVHVDGEKYWNMYTANGKQVFVLIDFNEKQESPRSMLAFLYDPATQTYSNGALANDRLLGNDKEIRLVLQSMYGINPDELPSLKPIE